MGGFSRFFIYRPIFAMVIAIVIVLLGALSIPILPIESVPNITPPTVKVSTSYPGASAEVLAETVAQPIEQEVNGVESMLYMSSKSPATGSMELTVTFAVGTDPDMAQVLTQNRVSIADPKLPAEVKQQGVVTKKQSTALVMVAALYSPDGRFDELYLSNYATTQVKDVLAREGSAQWLPEVVNSQTMGQLKLSLIKSQQQHADPYWENGHGINLPVGAVIYVDP